MNKGAIEKKVVIEPTEDLTVERFIRIVDELGLTRRIEESRTLIIKPNLAAGSSVEPESHAVTDLRLMDLVISGIRCLNPRAVIYIAESDSTGNGLAFLKFAHLGLDRFCGDRTRLLDLSRDRLTRLTLKSAMYFRENMRDLWLSSTLSDAHFLVSMSNPKTHPITGFSGTCKNWFGVLPSANKEVFHPHLDGVIHDLIRIRPPDLSILDGFRAMEGNGPVRGRGIRLGARVFAGDPALADRVGCEMMGIRYQRIRHLRLLCHGGDNLPLETLQRCDARLPGLFLRTCSKVGLFIQGAGESLCGLGHRIHGAKSFMELIVCIARPLLLKVFDIETLRKLKRKYIKS